MVMRSQPTVWLCVTALFLPQPSASITENFKIHAPAVPLVTTPGEDIVLPCNVIPAVSTEDLEVRWFRDDFAKPVYLYADHSHNHGNQMPSYIGRAALFPEELYKGNTSLRLADVRVSDDGQYKCFVQSGLWYGEVIVHLVIRASGTQPVISIEGHQEGGIGLVCESKGWYPEPALVWMDSEGQSLTAGRTETVRDNRDLFTVRGQVIVQERDINRYTCSVTQQQLNEGKDTKMYIPSEMFPRVSPWMMAFFVFFTFCLLALIVGLFFYVKLHREKDNIVEKTTKKISAEKDKLLEDKSSAAEEIIRLTAQLESLTVQKNELSAQLENFSKDNPEFRKQLAQLSVCLDHYSSELMKVFLTRKVDLTLDPSTAHPWLCVSSDGKQVSLGDKQKDISKHPQRSDSVYSVMSNESFGKGKRYWEVHVGEKTEWTLGVAKRVNYFFGSYKNCSVCCSVGKNKNGLIASSSSDNILQSLEPRKVGVYLDYEGGQVSFYSVGERAHICTCTIDTNRDDLYPYFSPGDSEDGTNAAPLIINPVGYGDK
ncbi:butyrophilin subfamily 2 member A1 [Amia ocellicauda]|uniref:butyrophilin subfamily 2 member A1 n=1 Tax=Amia ocellicauda TaxID=2972642 RepID=UPI0034643DA4